MLSTFISQQTGNDSYTWRSQFNKSWLVPLPALSNQRKSYREQLCVAYVCTRNSTYPKTPSFVGLRMTLPFTTDLSWNSFYQKKIYVLCAVFQNCWETRKLQKRPKRDPFLYEKEIGGRFWAERRPQLYFRKKKKSLKNVNHIHCKHYEPSPRDLIYINT